jgi:xylulokinase
MNLNEILETLRENIDICELGIIGGMAKGDIVCGIIADVMGMPIRRMKSMNEVASMGAAVVAGVGAGVFRDFSAVDRFSSTDIVIHPDREEAKVYQRLKPVFNEAYYALINVFSKLSEANS